MYHLTYSFVYLEMLCFCKQPQSLTICLLVTLRGAYLGIPNVLATLILGQK